METANKKITVTATIHAPIEKVWQYWTEPEHIKQWCQASDDWHAPYADNDLKNEGRFKTTMAAKAGSFSFDFTGIYTNVDHHQHIAYTIDDGRTVDIRFSSDDDQTTHVTETFEMENINPEEMQRAGWQSILDNFKKYTETN